MEKRLLNEKRKGWWRVSVRLKLGVLGLIVVSSFLVFLFGGQIGTFPFLFQGTDEWIAHESQLLGGLLSPDHDSQACLARYKSAVYRRPSPFAVSPYLIERLREYESYHKMCGPNSNYYKEAVEQLQSGKSFKNSRCKYVVWTKTNGLGNRMLSLVSTFLFSLLTNRVMLVHFTEEMNDLFCEPFPDSSWVLPPDFPVKENFSRFDKNASESYADMVRNNLIGGDVNVQSELLPPYVYLHLVSVQLGKARLEDNIFCENDQRILQKINWIILRSDCYFAAAFFLLPMYEQELHKLFPLKESVFHHLGRYLFHPTNPVWDITERFYKSYLSHADRRTALQIRVFPNDPVPFEKMFERVLECTKNEKLLPELGPVNSTDMLAAEKNIAVLVISLYSQYYDKIKAMYYQDSTVTGEMVSVYQPSHEERQNTSACSHNQKALAEIFLLSFCDKIAITSWSTFGYVSHGLAGIRPWIIRSPGRKQTGLTGACVRPESAEPCMHAAPVLKCRGKRDADPGTVVDFVRRCEDVKRGIKVYGYDS